MTHKEVSGKPLMLAIGGGKGGVGKSMVSANLAIHYALSGLKVILLDLDFGAANLHTMFGIRQPAASLADYFTRPRSKLPDYLEATSVENLLLVPGSGFLPELANLKHMQKVKLIKHIQLLAADLVILDLGAGSSNNVIDFFSMTDAGIVVTTPEPTATINAYEFLKNVVYRVLLRMQRHNKEISDIIRLSTRPNNEYNINTLCELIDHLAKLNPWVAETIGEVCGELDFYVVFNQARKASDADLGIKLRQICQRHLRLDLNYPGIIFHNGEVGESILKMRPIIIDNPESVTSKSLKRIASQILRQIGRKLIHGGQAEPFEQQFARTARFAQTDYEDNLLTQKRLQRRNNALCEAALQI